MSKSNQTQKLIVLFPQSDDFVEINSIKSITDSYKIIEKSDYIKKGKDLFHIPSVSKGIFYLPEGVKYYDSILKYANSIAKENKFETMILPYFFQNNTTRMQELVKKFEKYLVHTDLGYLRYASDPVLFEYFSGQNFRKSKRIYSPGDFFRKEQSGEMKGLKRMQTIHLTDYHIFTDDWWDEFIKCYVMNTKVMNNFSNSWFLMCDVEMTFFENNKERLKALPRTIPTVFRIMDGKSHYYSLQYQYTYVLSDGSTTQIMNLQLDFINGRRFKILVKDEPAVVIHGTITGRMEKIFLMRCDKH